MFRPVKFSASSRQRKEIVDALPLNRLTQQAQQRILGVAKSPTLYRRLPTQAIDCDRDMFLFLTRNPEVLVGIWDLMGITSVKTRRTGPYNLKATDGAGTHCNVELIYGDPNLHIYLAEGYYEGKLAPRPIHGKGVFVMRSNYAPSQGGTTVTGVLDCFVQIESLGIDLVARTLSGVIGRSADNNFSETARFISQVSQASAQNPAAMIDVAKRMPQVSQASRNQFEQLVRKIALSERAGSIRSD
ncbi:hypothetical protein N9D23_01005 [Rubripirellula sp.]|nr:hypothetical protein [Rubripirellula sp.]MDF1841791.1 hypothetical protein [Rubripirellula sp.]